MAHLPCPTEKMEAFGTSRVWRWHGDDPLQRRTVFTQRFVGRSSLGKRADCSCFPSLTFTNIVASSSSSSSFATSPDDDSQSTPFVEGLLIPSSWTSSESAAQEAEWLRINLHQWLDDEYCPEAANDEISKRCARVYYYCLLEKQRDLGDILMQMVRDLESFSFKESFHGAFSSANAAIDLITKKLRYLDGKN